MGHYTMIGILPKKNNVVLANSILVDGHTSYNELPFFLDALAYNNVNELRSITDILVNFNLCDRPKGYSLLTDQEMNSLKVNHTLSSADEQIDYWRSINESIKIKQFKAIKLNYKSSNNGEHEITYNQEYKANENWSKFEVIKGALYKAKIIAFGQLKFNIMNQTDQAKHYFQMEHMNFLYNSLMALRKIHKIDEAALIYYSE